MAIAQAIGSSVGRKILMSLTGLIMFSFVVGHMIGNLQIITAPASAYNQYGHFLISLGGLLIAVELILVGCLLVHVWTAIQIVRGKRVARPESYSKTGSAGGTSKKSLSSRTMIYTGLLLLVFIVVHVRSFKYGPAEPQGYVTEVAGTEMRDLHRLVIDKFSDPVWAGGYVIAMIILGVHLSHAFWSAFQSLGFFHVRYTPLLFKAGRVVAFAIALGFLIIPVWVYFTGAS